MTRDRSRDPSAFLARSRTRGAARAVRPVTVTALTSRLSACVEREFGRIAVCGEISEWKRATSGHIYFTLKDRSARLSSVIWRSQVDRGVPRDVCVGSEVVCFGSLEVYAPRGSYSLICDRIELAGRGDLHERFEQLKIRLRDEGLFDEGRKRLLPFLPRVVGVVTSPEGAALYDFLDTLQRRFSRPVVIAPTRVQGEGAAPEIARAVRCLARHDEVDVIVVTRGGGSLEDLWAFNEEVVARAIAACPIPVISAVGHETDVTVADFVADRRAKTPTEAAVLVVPAREELTENLRHRGVRLTRAMDARLERWTRRLETLATGRAMAFPLQRVQHARRDLERDVQRLVRAMAARTRLLERTCLSLEGRLQRSSPRRRLDERTAALERMSHRLQPVMAHRLKNAWQALSRAGALLDAHSPLRTMARGYSVVRKVGEERPLVSLDQTRPGDVLEILLRDGEAAVRVEQCHPRPPLQDVTDARAAVQGGEGS